MNNKCNMLILSLLAMKLYRSFLAFFKDSGNKCNALFLSLFRFLCYRTLIWLQRYRFILD